MGKAGRKRWIGGTVAAVLFVTAIGTLLVLAAKDIWKAMVPAIEFEARPFDADIWKSSTPEFSWKSVRLRMVDDLLKQHSLIGFSREQVVALIGDPDTTGYFREFDMVYRLGQERHPFGIDSEWLVLKLDEQCIVIQAEIVRD